MVSALCSSARYLWHFHACCLCSLHQLCMTTFMFYTQGMGNGACCSSLGYVLHVGCVGVSIAFRCCSQVYCTFCSRRHRVCWPVSQPLWTARAPSLLEGVAFCLLWRHQLYWTAVVSSSSQPSPPLHGASVITKSGLLF
ncbi:hypothetical protein COO60DRAFT_705258 [Scenedesmus sp. NREL 46B-D3]|nr:hypothetical protein COO60DRAFT_705258 [Scenedesmus sp. NREL 46B-D3]